MDIQNTHSAFLSAPEDYVPGGARFTAGHGGHASAAVLDEDLGPAAVDVAASGSGKGLSFGDLLDVVNPLQHIPVVSTLYRSMTGDAIAPAARVVGGALYGGPIGAGMAVANAIIEQVTGKDVGDTVLALVTDDGSEQGARPQTAATAEAAVPAQPAASQAAPATQAEIAAAAAILPAAGQPQATLAGAGAIPVGASAAPLGAVRQAPLASQPALNQQAMKELGVGRDVPQLSPAAFQTLMNSIGARPAATSAAAPPQPRNAQTAATPGNGLASGVEAAPAQRPVVPPAAMEVHKLLQGFATRGQRQ